MSSSEFFAQHHVFSVDDATSAWRPPRGKSGAVQRLRHHLRMGRIKRVTREIYAVVPPGVAAEEFRPDRFLVASTIRPDGVFAYHSALELLGVGHSAWSQCTLFADTRRRPLNVDGTVLRFLAYPKPLRTPEGRTLGTRLVEYRGRLLRTTGPERTLVEGLGRLALVGGPEEFVVSVSGLPVLDLELLREILQRYGRRILWAAVGWFLERYRREFHPPESYLELLAARGPKSPRYLERGSRGGCLRRRWNLIVPRELSRSGGSGEP